MFRHEKENPYERMRQQLGMVMDLPPEPPRFQIASLFPKAEDAPSVAEQFGLPHIEPPVAPGLVVNEYLMDGLLLGNADFEVNQAEAIYGICAEGDCSDE